MNDQAPLYRGYRGPPSGPMRVLLVKTSSLGDVVHNLPVASDLARRFPGVCIDWVVEEAFVDIPRLHPAVGQVIPVAVRRWRKCLVRRSCWSEIGDFRRRLRAETYDAVIDSQGLLKSALIARQSRLAPGGWRGGHDRGSAREAVAARFYDRGFPIPRHLHAVERNRRLAAAIMGYRLDDPCDYGICAPPMHDGWLRASVGDRPYAVLLTATSRASKEWPEERWQILMGDLRRRDWAAVLPGGSDHERSRAARLAAALPGNLAAPPLGLADMARLLAGARAVIGVDTGLVHLAAALGRPTIALFRASDPTLTGVYAGRRAVNLGAAGRPPDPSEVCAELDGLVAAT